MSHQTIVPAEAAQLAREWMTYAEADTNDENYMTNLTAAQRADTLKFAQLTAEVHSILDSRLSTPAQLTQALETLADIDAGKYL